MFMIISCKEEDPEPELSLEPSQASLNTIEDNWRFSGINKPVIDGLLNTLHIELQDGSMQMKGEAFFYNEATKPDDFGMGQIGLMAVRGQVNVLDTFWLNEVANRYWETDLIEVDPVSVSEFFEFEDDYQVHWLGEDSIAERGDNVYFLEGELHRELLPEMDFQTAGNTAFQTLNNGQEISRAFELRLRGVDTTGRRPLPSWETPIHIDYFILEDQNGNHIVASESDFVDPDNGQAQRIPARFTPDRLQQLQPGPTLIMMVDVDSGDTETDLNGLQIAASSTRIKVRQIELVD
ncbi:MAG: hypothetical protein ACOCZ8_02705 [Bacteroidota bacterium]